MEQIRVSFKERDMNKARKVFTIVELIAAVGIVAIVAAIAVPVYSGIEQKVRVSAALGDMGRIEIAVAKFLTKGNGALPANLAAVGLDTLNDPWGNPYQYLNIEATPDTGIGAVRKNRNLMPINSDYDLYSMGKDGKSDSPLTARESKDDIVRGANGAYFGLAVDL